ncbi:UDP-N-acetylmuramoyl-L-alanyl-D-glutamate--2,6-diaminopimelate ligase [Patescibacteria group bacterium]|nr:UDP-N-acetylmuramoyl-L-alanyl-D-glutamate--2,6-diaminopimelate ligase [Patescibacteria group bacterium]MBU1703274.1 UDP-N-acetylmuramoyl-L-alanyl-D-glutamate--2,6-diaminopimelate ligase [Patescibacteria group bacterium]MBU1954395.1 UDP-N-acetylmuramoyl-L-alanyl-D-glutamate--2,6-diaminopimelate ligase [Patescibacteria group bacterium]
MIAYLRKKISDTNPLRLLYHKIMAIAAAVYYRFPSRYLNVIAITGTKGKTTTVNLVTAILMEAGYKVGMTSTINFRVGDLVWSNATKITTLGPFFLQKMLRQMVNEHCNYAVLEVSSHSILQNRIWGINVDTAVFTNITEEHIDYHGGFENYLRAKGLLFERLNRTQRKPRIPKISILNKDDPHFSYFDQFLADKKYSYGREQGICFATDVELLAGGSKFVLHAPNERAEIHLRIPGDFNVDNAVAAATVGLANNINVTTIKDALEKASAIAGRYESIEAGQRYNIIVDYAHTAESLESLLKLYKGLTRGKLYTVFGATGGGRDKSKRPKMGKAADEYSDYVIVTDDDPYEENEWRIIEDVCMGIKRKEGQNFWRIPNREEAIKLALTLAKEGDTVVVAGKGAEEIQILRGKSIEWDDRKVIRGLLSREMKVEIRPGHLEKAENVYLQG